jgi:hypothetical protein
MRNFKDLKCTCGEPLNSEEEVLTGNCLECINKGKPSKRLGAKVRLG